MEILTIIAMILFIIGFLLLAVAVVAPGFGVPEIGGAACLVVGIFLAADSFQEGILITLVVLVLLSIMLAVLLRLLASGKLKSPLILEEEQKQEQGYISSGDLQYLLGKEGIATTDLRPSGAADFDGVGFDVISDGKYLEKGTPLIIYKVQGSKLMVKEKKD